MNRHGKRRCNVNRIPLCAGQALFWHHVNLTKQWYGPVHLALGRPQGSQEYWFVVSDEPTEAKTFGSMGCALTSKQTSEMINPMAFSWSLR